jgi:hypothetical protein
MAPWIDPMRQKICIAPHLPENIVLLRTLSRFRLVDQRVDLSRFGAGVSASIMQQYT